MAGRPPKPTALKLLQGNPGKRKLNDQEPKPAAGARMPEWFADRPELAAEWNRHAPRLEKLGLLTEIDDSALTAICILEVRLREIGSIPGSNPIDVTRELRALWGRFGMTPADRVRVKVEKAAPESKLTRFVRG
jgi:phage terminase small subunit